MQAAIDMPGAGRARAQAQPQNRFLVKCSAHKRPKVMEVQVGPRARVTAAALQTVATQQAEDECGGE